MKNKFILTSFLLIILLSFSSLAADPLITRYKEPLTIWDTLFQPQTTVEVGGMVYECDAEPSFYGYPNSGEKGQIVYETKAKPTSVIQVYDKNWNYITELPDTKPYEYRVPESVALSPNVNYYFSASDGIKPYTSYIVAEYSCDTNRETNACIDSLGRLAAKKDYTMLNGIREDDKCYDSSTLMESICSDNGRDYKSYDCKSLGFEKCQDGECVGERQCVQTCTSGTEDSCKDGNTIQSCIKIDEGCYQFKESSCSKGCSDGKCKTEETNTTITPPVVTPTKGAYVKVVPKTTRIHECLGRASCTFNPGDKITVSFDVKNVGDADAFNWIAEAAAYPDDWIARQNIAPIEDLLQSSLEYSTSIMGFKLQSCQDEPFVGLAAIKQLKAGDTGTITLSFRMPVKTDKFKNGETAFVWNDDGLYPHKSYQVAVSTANKCYAPTVQDFKSSISVASGGDGRGTNIFVYQCTEEPSCSIWEDVYACAKKATCSEGETCTAGICTTKTAENQSVTYKPSQISLTEDEWNKATDKLIIASSCNLPQDCMQETGKTISCETSEIIVNANKKAFSNFDNSFIGACKSPSVYDISLAGVLKGIYWGVLGQVAADWCGKSKIPQGTCRIKSGGADLCGWTGWSPVIYKDQCTSAYLIIGVILLLLLLFSGGSRR